MRIARDKTDWLEELPTAQQKEILAGLKDAEDDKVIGSKEFWENLKKNG